jgi:hypothetical protein
MAARPTAGGNTRAASPATIPSRQASVSRMYRRWAMASAQDCPATTPPGSLPGGMAGRSAVRSCSSPQVVAVSAAVLRASNSSRLSRPSAYPSRSMSTARSRFRSGARIRRVVVTGWPLAAGW